MVTLPTLFQVSAMRKPSNTIAGFSPEQVLSLRAAFEKHALYNLGRENLALASDGFSYADSTLDTLWGSYLRGAADFRDDEEVTGTNSTAMEDLRNMRRHSKCFTTAYDARMPSFTLIAKDAFAVPTIAQWLFQFQRIKGYETNPKYISAKATLGQFADYEPKNTPD